MFWSGLVSHDLSLSERLPRSLHVSQVALDLQTLDTEESVQLFVRFNRLKTLVATLNKSLPQTQLSLAFEAGKKVKFFIKGTSGSVHLSGFYIPDSESQQEVTDIVLSTEKDIETESNTKNDPINRGKDTTENGMALDRTANENKSDSLLDMGKELEDGVIVRDINSGKGRKVAKTGDELTVYFENRTANDGELINEVTEGEGFNFVVGDEVVIQGWNIGILGMKVHGKRHITSPPNVAYGAAGLLGCVPPNTTVISIIQLLNINKR